MVVASFEGSPAESRNCMKVIFSDTWQGASSCVSRKHAKYKTISRGTEPHPEPVGFTSCCLESRILLLENAGRQDPSRLWWSMKTWMNNAVLEALMVLGENSHKTLGLEVLNFRNLVLTGVNLCKLNPTCLFTTDSLGLVGAVFLKMKLLCWGMARGLQYHVCSLCEAPLALGQAVLVAVHKLQHFWVCAEGHLPLVCLYPSFTRVLLAIFPALGHAALLSVFSLPCLKVGIPPWLGLPRSAELLCLAGMAWTRSQTSTYAGDGTSWPQGVGSHSHLWRWGELEGGLIGRDWLQQGGSQLVLNTGRHKAPMISLTPGTSHAWELASSSAARRDWQELGVWASDLYSTKHEESRRPAPGPACG